MDDESKKKYDCPHQDSTPIDERIAGEIGTTKTPHSIAYPDHTKNQSKRHSSWREFREWATLVVSMATLAAVVWYAYIASKQWGETIQTNRLTDSALQETKRANTESSRLTQEGIALTQKQFALTRHALDLTERAWVFPSIEGPVFSQDGGIVNVLLRNTGKTPAFVEFAADSSLELIPPNFRGRHEGGIVIAAGQPEGRALPHVIRLSHPTKAEGPDVESGTKKLYIWVSVKYRDSLSADRFTQFCAVYHPEWIGPNGERTASCASQYQIFR